MAHYVLFLLLCRCTRLVDAASPHAVSNGDQGVGMASTCVVPLVRTAASDAVDSSKRTLPFDKSNFDLRKMNLFFELVWSKELMLAFNTRTAYYDGIRFTNVKPGVADSTPRQERRGRHRTLFSNVVLKDTRFSPATRHWVLQALGYTHLLRYAKELLNVVSDKDMCCSYYFNMSFYVTGWFPAARLGKIVWKTKFLKMCCAP